MASDMSTYFGNKVLRWLTGNTMIAAPASCEVGLFDGDPKGSGTEVTDTIRTAGRVAITFDAISEGTDNSVQNSADVDFGEAEAQVDFSHVAVFDDADNLLFAKALAGGPFADVEAGTPIKFPAGSLVFTLGS